MSTKKIQIIDFDIKQADNADTLDGKHADEFASASDVEALKEKVGDTSVSEQISSAIDGISYSVDDDLSDTSTNPVQNKVVTEAMFALAFETSEQIDSLVEAMGNKANADHTHSNYADATHTHKYAGSSSVGGAATSANKVNKSLSISLNGTSAGTFNGSSAVSVNITPSAIGAVTMDCSNISGTTSANKIIVSESEPTVENGAIWINPTPIVDTGWQEVALNTDNFKAYDGIASNSPVYRKIGDVVQIKGIVSPVNSDNSLGATTVTQIGSIPMEYAPSTLTVYAVCHGSNNAIWLLNVAPSGMIGAARYALGNDSSNPKTGVWMPFSVTYLI